MPEATLSPVRVRKFSKNPAIAFYQSSIGKKFVVGLTALILIVYVLGHLVGNLQIYLGQNRINTYAKFLHDLGPILWVVRVILLAAFVTHIVSTIQLANENRVAKPQKYAVAVYQRMLILGFRNPLVSLFYVLGLFLLASHLSHGFESVTQTLGINNRRISCFVSVGGQTLTWLIFAGYVSIPASILLGIIR
jgi:succinate dehydrogenase / fumarate reductase, cytochrome b subunit